MQNKVCRKTLRGLLGCFVQNVHHTLGMLRPPFPLSWCLVIFLSGKLICLLMEQIIFADTLSRCLLGCWLVECVINAIAFKCEGWGKSEYFAFGNYMAIILQAMALLTDPALVDGKSMIEPC